MNTFLTIWTALSISYTVFTLVFATSSGNEHLLRNGIPYVVFLSTAATLIPAVIAFVIFKAIF
jgi:hypothetical protein